MENASNALIIAGGILVGILVLSLAVYLFVDFGSTSAEVHKQQAVQQLAEFNSQFTVYEGRTDLTIHDIITVAGYALENNEYYGYESKDDINRENYITVTMKSDSGYTRYLEWDVLDKYNATISDELKNTGNAQPTYTCTSITYNDSGRVNSITFIKN